MEKITIREMWNGIDELRTRFEEETGKGRFVEFYPVERRGQPIYAAVHPTASTMNADELEEFAKVLIMSAKYCREYKYDGCKINYGF